MRKPNFFIIGAPKCGTTSLVELLASHPEVFMSPVKEPHFFNSDDKRGMVSLVAYENLFQRASDRHVAVGEASVWYLSSSKAIRNVLTYQPDARFVVMLRNPVEMAVALHAEMILSGHENVHEFESAWALQDERRLGKRVPRHSWAKRRLLYGDVCALGTQLECLLTLAGPDRILPVLLEDIVRDTRQEYVRILEFLGLNDDGRNLFPLSNRSRIVRIYGLTRIVFVLLKVKDRFHIKLNLHVWDLVARMNVVERSRPALCVKTRALLCEHFRPEIELLGRLLDKDLSHWLTGEPAS